MLCARMAVDLVSKSWTGDDGSWHTYPWEDRGDQEHQACQSNDAACGNQGRGRLVTELSRPERQIVLHSKTRLVVDMCGMGSGSHDGRSQPEADDGDRGTHPAKALSIDQVLGLTHIARRLDIVRLGLGLLLHDEKRESIGYGQRSFGCSSDLPSPFSAVDVGRLYARRPSARVEPTALEHDSHVVHPAARTVDGGHRPI